MSTTPRTRKTGGQDVAPQSPQGTPPPVGGGGDYSPFVWQQLGDIQKTLGRLESSVEKLGNDLDKVDGKMDKIESRLSGVTHKIYGATAVLAVLVALGGFIVNKAWDMMALSISERQPAGVQAPQAVPTEQPKK